ncbi:MAG: hypothetical protein U1A24_08025 [Cypionkella sp.]|uniref:hypothetical protein n=1 Tax=Cypionkella sp. TaxID=2811411 RepID=UPI002ABA1464|nr:hypothetical protein [Cypionkella sp.]MDZ4310490.1 hypothetical protein [Cypionkella sp.]MDZ4391728.1 hypothetical protein [Cypionkella sp.]
MVKIHAGVDDADLDHRLTVAQAQHWPYDLVQNTAVQMLAERGRGDHISFGAAAGMAS